ncbi:hypothetical protein AB0P41_01500 [Streptomyces sp. NPDC079167]|uniref:hypothetical protein n=1 Tax=Streptomyces sp. NPDC079167 TaxID=3154513 RepID=UPI003434BB8F
MLMSLTDSSRFHHHWHTVGADWYRYKNKNLTEYNSVEFKVCAGEWSSKKIVNGTCSG